MNQYVIARTKKATETDMPTQEHFLEKLVSIRNLDVPDNLGTRVNVTYPGTLDELREAVGWSSFYVHIEPKAKYDHL